jgi:hypothetical protein
MTTPNDSSRDLGAIQRWMQATIMHQGGVAEGFFRAIEVT